MDKIAVICIDDNREVLAALKKDLEPFEDYCDIEECESAEEAFDLMTSLNEEGTQIAVLICDHVMPEKNGIDFLIEVKNDPQFNKCKKVVLTGLATHQDTIIAINKAGIDRYLEKPWYTDELEEMVQTLVTEYLLENGIEYKPFMEILDKNVLYQALSQRF